MPDQTPIRISCGFVNAYLVRGRQGDVLVDTGMPGMAGRLLRGLTQAGSSPERLALIILTHVHFDHVANLEAIHRLSPAPILVHQLEAPLLAAGQVTFPIGRTAVARAAMRLGAALKRLVRFAPCPPDIVVEDDFSLQPFGIEGRILHTPGHTLGSLSLLLDEGDAIIGDLCQNGWGFGMGMGRINPPLADAPDLIAPSWDRLLQAGARRLYPGHGTPFDRAALQRARDRRA